MYFIGTFINTLQVAQLQVDREQVAKDIADKLGTNSGVSYIDIAKQAIKYGRYKLAVKVSIIYTISIRFGTTAYTEKLDCCSLQKYKLKIIIEMN